MVSRLPGSAWCRLKFVGFCRDASVSREEQLTIGTEDHQLSQWSISPAGAEFGETFPMPGCTSLTAWLSSQVTLFKGPAWDG